MLTYLMRDSWDIKQDSTGANKFELVAVYVGRRETTLTFDPTRPGVFALLALQAGCNVSNKVVTLPHGIVIPEGADIRDYVVAYGTVNGTRRRLTVTAVDEGAGMITVAETTDAGTTVDVYCVPRIPLLVELRMEVPHRGLTLSRTLWTEDVSVLAERSWWKAGSGVFFPASAPLPEDWILAMYVRSSLPVRWVDPGTYQEIPHRIAIPVVIATAQGMQDALKQSLLSELSTQ